jgi:hypothetical protein
MSRARVCGNVTRRAPFQTAVGLADRWRVRLGRTPAVLVLGITALVVVVVSAASAYATFDFWEGGPILASLSAAAAASAGALYLATRRVVVALGVATVVVAAHFVLLLAITLARWEG